MQSVTQPEPASPASNPKDKDEASVEDLRNQKAALEDQNQKLKQAAEYRSAFLARLAHELRTPLTSVLGFSEILLTQEQLTDAQRGFCERIQNSAHQLQQSLNQLSDLSRLEAGQSELLREEFSLEDLLMEACSSLARQAKKQNAELRCVGGSSLPLIISDRGRLSQVVYNFMAYAITRSPGALVLVTAEKDSSGFILKIEDEGESPVDCKEFIELDTSNRRSGNSELGLAIARQNLELLGASLSFQNRQPRGLQVLIQFPDVPADSE
ncbi:MAG: two-component system, NarL family, sensor histidine kinase BarA [Blastocatellia bacterium]|jgi:signal transduction histidine kinase|nr:two-component system, NarL family, sensor histidine kinase BarA [Blastocatellia bacterium]